MDESDILDQLEELAMALDVEVRHESLKYENADMNGGLIKLQGKNIIIINTKMPVKDKIHTLASALKNFDLSTVFIRPGLRDLLENFEP